MKVQLIFIIVLFFVAVGCNSDSKNKENSIEQNKLLSPVSLSDVLSTDQLEFLGFTNLEVSYLKELYNNNENKAFWIEGNSLSQKGIELNSIVSNLPLLGIPNERFNQLVSKDLNIYQTEILITFKLACLKSDLNIGFLSSETKSYRPYKMSSNSEFYEIRKLGLDTCLMPNFLIQLGPNRKEYSDLAKANYHYIVNNELDTLKFEVPLPKKDSLHWEEILSKALDYKKIAPADSISKRIIVYQNSVGINPTGVLGERTVKALATSSYDKFLKTALAMERWRWKSKNPDRFVRVNIPEYTLRFVVNDTILAEHRVVVGTTETPTPQLFSTIHTVIIYPFWTVPSKIASDEILPAVKRNPNYLSRNHYRIFRGETEVAPSSINWASVGDKMPYKVRQDFGTFNSLGIVKFDFHNQFGVYIHDTPKKKLFNNANRNYSHGCVRCEKPLELAKLMLLRDENLMLADSLDSMLARGIQTYIPLKNRIPITLDYITVTVQSKNLIFHYDIYGRDDFWLSTMKRSKIKTV